MESLKRCMRCGAAPRCACCAALHCSGLAPACPERCCRAVPCRRAPAPRSASCSTPTPHTLSGTVRRYRRWDEEVYGLEYDLDLFNIVAVDDFNMGAAKRKRATVGCCGVRSVGARRQREAPSPTAAAEPSPAPSS